jgi:hypothetical protein
MAECLKIMRKLARSGERLKEEREGNGGGK